MFAWPPTYEPMGIANFEAIAHEAPVVATAIGGIPQAVAHGATGLLVRVTQHRDGEPVDPDRFVTDFARTTREQFAEFSWAAVAAREAAARVRRSGGSSV